MLMHVDHLIPGLELESDVRLKAGSFLITRKELPDARLNDSVIESIRRCSRTDAKERTPTEKKMSDADQLPFRRGRGTHRE